jgi:hypothetical protein
MLNAKARDGVGCDGTATADLEFCIQSAEVVASYVEVSRLFANSCMMWVFKMVVGMPLYGESKISPAQRDRLLSMIAQIGIDGLQFAPPASRSAIVSGLQALTALIVIFAEPSARAARRPPRFVFNARASARIAQNLLHNAYLAEGIAIREGLHPDVKSTARSTRR